MGRLRADLVVLGAREVLTMPPDAGPARGTPDDVGRIVRGAVACAGERIAWVGPEADLAAAVDVPKGATRVDASDCVVLPGLVEPHTHLVFGGERSSEFHRRNAGASYQAIAAAGGGIASTVLATRAASDDELLVSAGRRLRRFAALGVTTLEAKSGYGLDPFHERRILELVRALSDAQPVDLVPTFLGAHTVPPEYRDDRGAYLDLVCEQMIPEVAKAGLAEFCDVFCEEGAFSLAEGRRVLEAGLRHGLAPRVHAEQFTTGGGARLAADLGAASCDHLEAAGDDAAEALAAAGTVAVLLPGVPVFLGTQRFAPARRLLAAGVRVALGTDCNPGTCHTEDLWLVATLGCTCLKLTAEEALAAITVEAARSLRRLDRCGSLRPGLAADLVAVQAPGYAWLPYHMGAPDVRHVVKGGVRVTGGAD